MSSDDPHQPVSIRRATVGDAPARRVVISRAWDAAYAHIYSAEEIAALLEERVQQDATWRANRREILRGLVAEHSGMIVGAAALALLHNGDGEITSL